MDQLTYAVLDQLGFESLDSDAKQVLNDVANYGADAGFSGFIYYSDTIEFFDNNKSLIVELMKNDAESLGEDCPFCMVANFNCLRGTVDALEVANALTTSNPNNYDYVTSVKNALAWYALETVAYRNER